MPPDLPASLAGTTAVLLPGTGSDDDYVHRAFAPALHAVGASVLAVRPEPARLIPGYRDALDEAARVAPIAVGGVSLGAAVAAAWAREHADRTVAVLAALPAWTGSPGAAPAASAARWTARTLRADGLAGAIAAMRASSPPWLADELTRSWTGMWPDLPTVMEAAADYVAPTVAELAGLSVPMGIAAATDDPVHPLDVAVRWASAAPRAALVTTTLDALGADPGVLGASCLAALNRVG